MKINVFFLEFLKTSLVNAVSPVSSALLSLVSLTDHVALEVRLLAVAVHRVAAITLIPFFYWNKKVCLHIITFWLVFQQKKWQISFSLLPVLNACKQGLFTQAHRYTLFYWLEWVRIGGEIEVSIREIVVRIATKIVGGQSGVNLN